MATSFNLKTGAEDVHFTAESSHRESDPEADESDNVDAVNEATNEDEPSSKSSALLEQSVLRSSCCLSHETTMAMTILRDLPMDLVEEEILCYVPTMYLKRLISTSKRWNRLFNGGDSRFAREHTDKAAKEYLVLLVKEYRICPTIVNLHKSIEFKSELSLVDSQSMDSAQFDIARAFHCDGLLLCASEDASRFVVWNPFTNETRWFSTGGAKGRDFVLGYYEEDNDKRYKILSIPFASKDYEIYEFSSDSWRILDDIIAPCWSIIVARLCVSLKGNTYWLAYDGRKKGNTYWLDYDGTKAQHNISLLKFDFKIEKYVHVPLPYQCPRFESIGLSVVREEKLSMLLQCDVTSKTEIWVTNKIDETTQVVSWSKVLALDLCPDLQICDDVNFFFDEVKKVVMMSVRWVDIKDENMERGKDMIYIVGEDDEVTQVELGTDESSIVNYVPSLVQIQQAGRKRKRCNL